MPDSYLAGLEILDSVGIGQDELRNRAAEVAPEFVRLAIGFTYGEIFSRPGLDLKTRMLVAIAAETAAGSASGQLRDHVQAALRLGWTEREIIEAIIQTSAHSGLPTALRALTDCHDLLAVREPGSQSCEDESCDTGQE